MDIATLSKIIDLGSAGAVIAVVIIFLRSNEKRDSQWRDFFTALNTTNKDDVCKLAETMERMVKSLDEHDARARAIMSEVSAIKDVITKPLPRPGARKAGGD